MRWRDWYEFFFRRLSEGEVLINEVQNDHGNPLAELEAVGDQMRDNQLENLLLERDSLRDALASAHVRVLFSFAGILADASHAQSDVLHHESEVQVLREALDQQNMELAHLNASNEFAEAEVRFAVPRLANESSDVATDRVGLLVLACEIRR